jgi:hypothetical protein
MELEPLIAGVGFCFKSGFGLRLLLSRSFRQETLSRWEGDTGINVGMEISGALLCFGLTTVLVWMMATGSVWRLP